MSVLGLERNLSRIECRDIDKTGFGEPSLQPRAGIGQVSRFFQPNSRSASKARDSADGRRWGSKATGEIDSRATLWQRDPCSRASRYALAIRASRARERKGTKGSDNDERDGIPRAIQRTSLIRRRCEIRDRYVLDRTRDSPD